MYSIKLDIKIVFNFIHLILLYLNKLGKTKFGINLNLYLCICFKLHGMDHTFSVMALLLEKLIRTHL